MNLFTPMSSLDAPIRSEDPDECWIERTESDDETPDDACLRDEVESALWDAIMRLGSRERKIVVWRYLAPRTMTLAAIGRHLGFSRERARQIEAAALQKIGAHLRRKGLAA